jgi:amino acid adenylation domain-containing protein
VAVTAVAYLDELPVTASQRSLLFIQEAATRKDLYNNSYMIVFDAPVEPAAMRTSLERLIRLQPALRTVFSLADGAPGAQLAPAGEVPLDVLGHDGPGHDGQDDWARRLEEQSVLFAAVPIDVNVAPLCRFRLLTDERRAALLVTMHHVVSDGASVRVLVDEIRDGYRLATGVAGPADADDEPEQAEREAQLERELRAQHAATEAAVAAGGAETFAEALAGVPPTTLYPVPARPQNTRFSGGRSGVLLSTPERARLEQAARDLATTPYELLLACYAILLGDYSGNDGVVVGSPFATRRTIASHDLCGFFVNTLPLALPTHDTSFAAHCATVARTVRTTRGAQAVPFDSIVQRVAPERSTNRNPLFQCMFAMQDGLRTRLAWAPGIEGRIEIVHNGSAKFDLWLGATPVEDGMRIEIEYDADLLPAGYAERFLTEYRTLLLRAVDAPSTPTRALLADLDTRTARLRRDLLLGPEASGEATGGLLGLVLDAARRTPEAVAVSEPGRMGLTYAELVERSGNAAAGLRARGVRPGNTVAIVADTLPDTVVAMLAVLWTGAAYLPVDTALPADRLRHMLDRSDCRFTVGRRAVLADEPPRATVDELEDQGRALERPAPPGGDDPVYIMFTSGSTGLPKGVHMGQAPLINLLRWQLDELDMGPETRFLQFAPLGFDVSYQEIFPTLACGGTVFGLGEVDRRDLEKVAAVVDEARLTHIYLPVAVLGAFAGTVLDAGLPLEKVRHICVSGEQLHLDDRTRRLLSELPERALINLYGPTETTAVTFHVLRGDRLPDHDHVPIGRPVPGVDAHLLGQDGRDVPPGAVGELYLGGVCPAVGYINDEERTAAAFLPAPGGAGARAGRVYRTGDLALLAEDGTLAFLGRRDTQVKVRGHRVELGEIESAAERVPEVAAAVAAVHGTGEQAALCLFVRPAPGARVDDRLLRTALERKLPAYMIPRHLLSVDAVPLTANGKVDRKALLSGFAAGELSTVASEGPAAGWVPTATERTVRELWGELLGHEPAGPDESFFLLGGNSFDILRLVRTLERTTGVRVPVGDFFRGPTVRALAALIDGPRGE